MVGGAAKTGTSIHREVGTILQEINMLSSTATNAFKGSNGAKGIQADLSWSGSGLWSDLTTAGQWNNHLNTYSSKFGAGLPMLYQVGRGVVDTHTPITQIYSGVSSALTGSQALFGGIDFLSGANGGYLLYPNKPNNNMMQSVYRK